MDFCFFDQAALQACEGLDERRILIINLPKQGYLYKKKLKEKSEIYPEQAAMSSGIAGNQEKKWLDIRLLSPKPVATARQAVIIVSLRGGSTDSGLLPE